MPGSIETHVLVNRERYEQLRRDAADMMNAAHTIFGRCACGRMRERAIICPTNQEGGHCEAGS